MNIARMRWFYALLVLGSSYAFGQPIFVHGLAWQSQGDVAAGYKVYRSTNSGPYLALLNTTSTSVLLTNTQPMYYRYRITSFNDFGESIPSNEVGVDMRTSGKSPKTPTNLVLTITIPTQ